MKEKKRLGGIRQGPEAHVLFRAIFNEGQSLRFWFAEPHSTPHIALAVSDILIELERLGWELRPIREKAHVTPEPSQDRLAADA